MTQCLNCLFLVVMFNESVVAVILTGPNLQRAEYTSPLWLGWQVLC